MDPVIKLMVSGMLLALAPVLLVIASSENDLQHCENTVINWANAALVGGPNEDKLTLRDLLFFLHIPRTGGRTYFHCFLRKLYIGEECPRSYDKLRFDPSKPNCRLVGTHDDYSVMTKLPKQKSSVVTILRNPVDRVFSTYEFSVEVAARFLIHSNLTSAIQISGRLRHKARGVSTLDIWPWKYLVPWMREDLFGRRDVRKLKNMTEMEDATDSYNMEDIVMPLHMFINDRMAHEIVHNGATFQIAGLTNNSCIDKAHEIRHCVNRHPKLGQYVLHVAKKRLDDMLYVGLTEEHKESATIFAQLVGSQVISMLENRNYPENSSLYSPPSNLDSLENSMKEQKLNLTAAPEDNVPLQSKTMTVTELMESYEACTTSLRKSQKTRRTDSLKRIAPAKFSKEARLGVPQTVLNQILQLNSLDVELYKHAQNIFVQQRKLDVELYKHAQNISGQQQKLLRPVVEYGFLESWSLLTRFHEDWSSGELVPCNACHMHHDWCSCGEHPKGALPEQLRLARTIGRFFSLWKMFGLFTVAFIFITTICHVRSKRRNSKLKI